MSVSLIILNLFLLIIFVVVFILAAIFVTLYKFNNTERNLKLGKLLPGPKSLPILGYAIKIALLKPTEIFDFAHNLLTTYKPLFALRNFGHLLVVIWNPDHVEELLKSTKHIKKGIEYNPLIPWLKTGLLTSSGTKWMQRRKMITPTFHFAILEQYLPIICQNSKELCSKMDEELWNTINIIPYFSESTLKVIVETAMGTRLDGKEGQDYIKSVNEACGIVLERATNSLIILNNWIFHISPQGFKSRRILKTLHTFTEKVIQERRKNYLEMKSKNEVNQKKRRAFLDYLIEFSEQEPKPEIPFTDLDIREEVDTFMFEGHDTTSMGLSYTLFLLSCHPEIQEKAVIEINEIFDSLEEDADLTLEHLKRMEYLEQVIKESLRLFPSVPYISRWLEHDLELGGYTVPADTNVSLFPYLIHRNPKYYPEPEKFNPDRFSKENSVGRHPFSYIPFSAGPRNCIGQKFAMMEVKIFIASLLRRFRFEAISKLKEIKHTPHVILRPADNKLLVRVLPRT